MGRSRRPVVQQEAQAPTPFQEKARRRVSFGGSVSNDVPKLHTTSEEKKEMWYNQSELRKLQRTVKKIVRQEVTLDETEDCWRGLETYVRQHQASLDTDVVSDQDTCNQIILQLQQHQQNQGHNSRDKNEGEQPPVLSDRASRDLQTSAQRLLRRAMRSSKKQAAQDALEAHAIYLETMDSQQVQSCFRSACGA